MAETINKTIQVCDSCGSYDVERKVWENQKTGDLSDACLDDDDNWCNGCEEHTSITYKDVTEDEYEQMERDKPRFEKAVKALKDCKKYIADDKLTPKEIEFRKELFGLCMDITYF